MIFVSSLCWLSLKGSGGWFSKIQWFFFGLHLTKDQGSALFLDRFHDPGVAVASIRDSNPAGEVDVLVAFGIVDINTFRAFRLDLGQVGPDWGEVFYGLSH